MMSAATKGNRVERITEWVAGGCYAVAVQVQATYFSDRPDEAFLTPETVRFLERVARDAREGNLEALREVGKVYVLLEAVQQA